MIIAFIRVGDSGRTLFRRGEPEPQKSPATPSGCEAPLGLFPSPPPPAPPSPGQGARWLAFFRPASAAPLGTSRAGRFFFGRVWGLGFRALVRAFGVWGAGAAPCSPLVRPLRLFIWRVLWLLGCSALLPC